MQGQLRVAAVKMQVRAIPGAGGLFIQPSGFILGYHRSTQHCHCILQVRCVALGTTPSGCSTNASAGDTWCWGLFIQPSGFLGTIDQHNLPPFWYVLLRDNSVAAVKIVRAYLVLGLFITSLHTWYHRSTTLPFYRDNSEWLQYKCKCGRYLVLGGYLYNLAASYLGTIDQHNIATAFYRDNSEWLQYKCKCGRYLVLGGYLYNLAASYLGTIDQHNIATAFYRLIFLRIRRTLNCFRSELHYPDTLVSQNTNITKSTNHQQQCPTTDRLCMQP
ncbi:hypothetical protein J6590_019015 [Homalodisca vitripennis]|nr:hypothetical protein J6590_019015 [Homalodisca vitripennis]